MYSRIWAIFVVSTATMLILFLLGGCARLSLAPAATIIPTRPLLAATKKATGVPTALPVASPTSAGPLLYTVRLGDTLGAIAQAHGVSVDDLIAANDLANPDVLSVGQTLTIPVGGFNAPTTIPPTDAPSEPSPTLMLPTSLPTLTPSGPPLVEIDQALASGDAAAEVVVVRNRGGMVSLEGWTLADAEGNTFTFPALTLFSDAKVRVHSTEGNSMPGDLYWGRVNPAWSEGELITLSDATGNAIDTYIVP
ncbi:MAG: hypothetical protein B6I35_15450 [Anaerolineaceae bacterium 4572_32.2]|nr:MAG: hypothetical protein B6I35_15450 [Anaerolineaceae bacterium 4572_32.2]HEY72879.1 LysM peptidoglycan-binding domain-containing protein [Thermoflexia bacterium]